MFLGSLLIIISRDDRQAYLNLQSDCKTLSSKIKKLDNQCSVEMVKRFGEGVSMHDIESFAVNKTLEEMKEVSKRKQQALYTIISKTTVSIIYGHFLIEILRSRHEFCKFVHCALLSFFSRY